MSEPTRGFRLQLPEEFMRHFRWITPLLLLFLNVIAFLGMYIVKEFLDDFKEQRLEIQRIDVHIAKTDGVLETLLANMKGGKSNSDENQ